MSQRSLASEEKEKNNNTEPESIHLDRLLFLNREHTSVHYRRRTREKENSSTEGRARLQIRDQ